MKKLFVSLFAILTLGVSSLSAAGASPVYQIDPYIAVDWDSNGAYITHEQLQAYQQTTHDFNDMVQSQIVVWGYPTAANPYPAVKIGSSIGSYVGKQAITNSSNIIVGYVMGFDHYTVTQGYLTSQYSNVYNGTAYIR